MDVGKEFSSWESFMHALEQYSREHKVVYVVGLCKLVEEVNKNVALQAKFPGRFKYCFARMLCKHNGSSYHSTTTEMRPQRKCKTGCTSSILVTINKKKTAIVITEANLEHTHDVSESNINQYAQKHRLQGEQRHMASVLLRSGVSLSRVQEFLSSVSKESRSKDAQNVNRIKGSSSEKDNYDFSFLADLDQLMAEDADSIVEMINFAIIPEAIYIQTSKMTERMKSLKGGHLQIITHKINDGKVSVISITGIDSYLNPYILALCIISVNADTVFCKCLESFVQYNPEFCDSLTGVVLDCLKENADFLQLIIPQIHVAWSRSYILERFTEEVKNSKKDIHKNMQLRKELMNANCEEEYEKKLKELFDNISSADSKDFLRNWDLCKELWVQCEISSHPGLDHQKSAVEMDYVNFLKPYFKSSTSLSDVMKSVLKLNRNEEPEETVKAISVFVDPSCEQYQSLCFPEIAMAVVCQLSIALSSLYEIKEQTDVIFVKKKDTEDEFILDVSGTKCTCRYFLDSDLPCQHIFAWLHSSGKPLYNELLIPAKWQVFGKSITLDVLAESLAQGYVPSSRQHDERLRELQLVLKDTLSFCCSHSYQQMGKDLVLLKQVLSVMRNNQAHSAEIYLYPEERDHQQSAAAETPNSVPGTRKRGRPSKKAKEQQGQQQSLTQQDTSMTPNQETPLISKRFNLRTNIKHKFVTRTLHSEDKVTSKTPDRSADQATKHEGSKTKLQNEDQNNSLRIGRHRSDMSKAAVGLMASSSSGGKSNTNNKISTSSDINGKEARNSEGTTHESSLTNNTIPRHLADSSQIKISTKSQRESKSLSGLNYGIKRPHAVSETDEVLDNDENKIVDEEMDEGGSVEGSSDDDDDDESDSEAQISKRAKSLKEIEMFFGELPPKVITEVMQVTSVLKPQEERCLSSKDWSQGNPDTAADFIVRACQSKAEYVDVVMDHISKTCPGYSKYAYQVAGSVICRAFLMHTSVPDMLQSVSEWPQHLPDLPVSRPFIPEVTLAEGQTLTVCGHKLSQGDVDTLKPGEEMSPKVLHAYLEILAQKHSGKMLVIPFDVILGWREGRFSQNIFRKVHFKTFEYLILPIHCGAEFTATERSGDIVDPCWMALVANVKQRTVGMMNPRNEDKYIIAANGYMLQWRRYMQIRSVHTGEMLSSWTTKWIECSTVEKNVNSGIHLLMNVEALINGVPPVVMSEAHILNYFHLVAVALRDMDRETTVLCVGGPECQQLAARDADWLQCENCCTWWHHVCARHLDMKKPFYCSPCQHRIAIVGGKRELLEAECDEVEEEDEVEEQADETHGQDEKEDKDVDDDQKIATQESS